MFSIRTALDAAVAASLVLICAAGAPGVALEERADDASTLIDRGVYTAPNGEAFTYVKQVGGAEDTVTFYRDGVAYDAEALQRYKRENPPPIVDRDLRETAERAGAAPIEVIVWLKNRPGAAIAQQVQEVYAPELKAISDEVVAIQRQLRLDGSLSPEEERAYIDFAQRGYLQLTAAQQAVVDEAKQTADALSAEIQREVRRQTERAIADDQRQLARAIGQLRGSVDAVIVSQNAAQITLPGSSVARLAEMPEVARMMAVPVMEPHLDKQDDSLGLRTGFWNDNVDGGVWDVGVLDTGVQQNHPSLDHLTFESTHGTTDSNGHGTKVAGIIASDHGTYRGMAYSLDNMLVGDCISKSIKHGDWMVGDRSDDPEVISMSCGSSGSVSSDYSSSEKFWDALVDNHRVLFINSAGNTGDGTSTITRPATAYNLISVANVYDNDTTSRSDDFLRYTSARGPSFGGRKKPDLSAPGHNTKTTNNDWATSDDFVNFGGTSAAAPHVAGGAILVTDLRSNDDPKATKAVLINSADAWDSNGKVNGSQWNKEFGWGYLNLGKAWLNGTDVFTHTIAEGGTEYKLYLGTMHAWEKATLVWHRHADYNGSSTPTQIADLTDLDLYAYRATNGAKMDSSISFVDNVEQVTVNADGEYVLKVKLIGDIDSSLPNQAYALATEENFIQVDPPSLSAVAVDVVTPSGFPGLFPVQMIVLVTNSGDAPAGRTAIWPDAPNGWAAVPLIPELTVPGNTTLAFPIMVFSNCTSAGQTGTIDITAVSGAYGEDYVATTTGTVNCI